MTIHLSDHFNYRRLLRFVLPSIVMMLVTSTYSVIDGFFVSNLVGKGPFASVNLILPAIMGISSLGMLFGSGGSALISFTLGTGNRKRACQLFSMLLSVLVGVGLVLSVLAYIFMPQIAWALGADETLVDNCVLYGRVLICAMPFFLLQNAFSSLMITAERPKIALGISVAAGLTNVVGDFLLVYLFPLGLFGAALATALSYVAGGGLPILYFIIHRKTALLRFTCPIWDLRALAKACGNGSSEMVSNLSVSLASILYNYQLMQYAGENGVAAYGVIMYVSFIFQAIFLGYSMGISPVVGYHYGADNIPELQNLTKKSLILIPSVSLLLTALAELTVGPISRIFVGYDAELLAMTITALRLYSLSFLISGLNILGSAFFTALNNGPVSAAISFLRTLLFQVAAVLILPRLLGLEGIWLAVTAAELMTLVITVFFFLRNRSRYHYI